MSGILVFVLARAHPVDQRNGIRHPAGIHYLSWDKVASRLCSARRPAGRNFERPLLGLGPARRQSRDGGTCCFVKRRAGISVEGRNLSRKIQSPGAPLPFLMQF
jgi:hypothetical protein